MTAKQTECPSCGSGFDSQKGMRIHHKLTHGEKIGYETRTCEGCGDEYRRKDTIIDENEGDYCSQECSRLGARGYTSDEKETIILDYQSGKTISTLANEYDVYHKTVVRWLKKWNVDLRDQSVEVSKTRCQDFELTTRQMEIVEGELLGDGCITKSKDRPDGQYYFVHGSVVKAHTEYLIENLPDEAIPDYVPTVQQRDENSQDYWRVNTRHSPLFTELRERWYPNGNREVPDDFELTERAMYHWYIGDGGLHAKGNISRGGVAAARFATDGFSRSSVEHLVSELDRLGYDCTVVKCSDIEGGPGLRIALTADATRDFLTSVDNPIPEYDYKWQYDTLE